MCRRLLAAYLLPYVKAILEEAYAQPGRPVGRGLADRANRIEAVIRSRHPEIDEKALKTIGNHFTFNSK